MRYVIGIDGGGTSCRAALADRQGRILGCASRGPANIRTDLVGAFENIEAAVAEAADQAGVATRELRQAVAVLGLAGSNAGDYPARLLARLDFRDSLIVNDGLVALHGALGAHDGVVGIVGTGSVFLGRAQGAVRTIGGWGFEVGDLGGGARLGRRLLEDCLLAYDGAGPASALTRRVFACFEGDPAVLVEAVRGAAPEFYGKFVPRLCEAAGEGDPVANAILDAGCRDVERMFDALMAPDTARLCLLGGLAPVYAPRLRAAYRARLTAPLGDALAGAIALALCRADALERLEGD
ncbi:MAG: hypothetical protein B7Z80_18355 [Rhodospirillales bacterium 20-64-7]|nr:MAG: hypothetical protein B7Z80_18355 [Rhodospirillales bacterium 20-64-7]